MKYIRATFKGYIGFYNGMGLDTIDIDFTKCTHKIILINGKNGSGKSTLMNHLNPFPDGSNSFIPNKDAEKDLVLFHEGDTYSIQIYSPADMNGKRKTSKAYIQKNGIELNENGNIQSYKDIIFSEFEMDSNYISLSRLSSNDRGLGDKTPAERKKFVANIIENLEIYNDMYKTLNKKSLIYKSHVNNIHTKIQNIGTKESLVIKLNNLTSKQKSINGKILEINNNIVAIQAKNTIDEEEANKITRLNNEESEIRAKLDSLKTNLDLLEHKTKIPRDKIVSKYTSDCTLQVEYRSKYSNLSDIWKDKSNRLSSVTNDINSLEADLSSFDNNNDISSRYNASNVSIKELQKEISSYNIKPDINLIMSLNQLSTYCDRFDRLIEHFYDGLNSSDIEFIVKNCNQAYINSMNEEKNTLNNQIANNNLTINTHIAEMELLNTLTSRPSKCKIDDCKFISSALELKKSLKYKPQDAIDKLSKENNKISKRIREIDELLDKCNGLLSKKSELDIIRNGISENASIIQMFYPDIISNFDNLIINLNTFSRLRDHKEVTDVLNALIMLDAEITNNKILEAEYNSYKDKIQLINSSKVRLEKLKSEEKELISDISSAKSDIDSYSTLLSELDNNISIESEYSSTYEQYKNIEADYNVIKSSLDEYNRKSSKALEEFSKITAMKQEIDNLNIELNPINNEISNITGMLGLLETYYNDLELYKNSYNTIEILKKYCNPTGGGIQTLFMQMYMGKTKEISNQVLAMLFNGAYRLEDFIINNTEFKIPFVGEGLPVEDISYGSASQIAMMGMIINLVLLHQGSTKFNIAQLDEITGPLDSYNNSQFTTVLFYCMDILNIEQLFLISHSTDTDNTFADIIKLKGYDNYESSIQSGNVIWDYDDIVKHTDN